MAGAARACGVGNIARFGGRFASIRGAEGEHSGTFRRGFGWVSGRFGTVSERDGALILGQ